MPVICLVKKGSFTLVGVCDGSGRGFTEIKWGTKSNMAYNFKVQVSWGGGKDTIFRGLYGIFFAGL